jgi:hypothetical protein
LLRVWVLNFTSVSHRTRFTVCITENICDTEAKRERTQRACVYKIVATLNKLAHNLMLAFISGL